MTDMPGPDSRIRTAMRLDVPFIPDRGYLEYLMGIRHRLAAMHFSLFSDTAQDARTLRARMVPAELEAMLALVPNVPKHALLNSRFNPWEGYQASKHLDSVAGTISMLRERSQVHGLVVADLLYLKSLARHCPEAVRGLDLVFSVNLCLSSPRQLDMAMAAVHDTGLTPKACVSDRNLNRNFKALEGLVSHARKHYPDLSLALLANEGCLLNCPYKLTHDALMAHGRMSRARSTYELCMDLGCGRDFYNDPALIFSSPFIRPEELDTYARFTDTVKICGRNHEARHLRNIVQAYVAGEFKGNLLYLLDTLEMLMSVVGIENSALPELAKALGNCAKNCLECGFCRDLAGKHVRIKAPELLSKNNL